MEKKITLAKIKELLKKKYNLADLSDPNQDTPVFTELAGTNIILQNVNFEENLANKDMLVIRGECEFNDKNANFLIWFQQKEDDLEPSYYLLVNNYALSFSGESSVIKPPNITTDGYTIITNSSPENHKTFCNSIPNGKLRNYKDHFANYAPQPGTTYRSHADIRNISIFNSLKHLLPDTLEKISTSIQVFPNIASKSIFDVEFQFGDVKKNKVSLSGLTIGFFFIQEDETLLKTDLTLRLGGVIDIDNVSIEFGGSYPTNSASDIEIYGLLNTDSANPIKNVIPAGLPDFKFEGSVLVSFNKDFEITHYEFDAHLDGIEGLIPASPSPKFLPEITSASLSLEGENFSTTPSVLLQFNTKLLDWVEISTQLSYPEKVINASLIQREKNYTLGELFEKCGWKSAPSQVKELSLNNLELKADLPLKDYSFTIEIGSVFKIGDIIALENLTAYLHYQKVAYSSQTDTKTPTSTYDFYLEGTVDIGGYDFIATVSFSNSNDENTLTISAQNSPDSPLPIGEFISNLAKHIGVSSISIPKSIEDFKVISIGFEFISTSNKNKSSNKFNFNFEGSTEILDSDLELEVHFHGLRTGVSVSETSIEDPIGIAETTDNDSTALSDPEWEEMEFSGAIIIADYKFSVVFDAVDDLLLAYFKNEGDGLDLATLIAGLGSDEISAFIPKLNLAPKNTFVAFCFPKKPEKGVLEDEKPRTTILFGLELGLESKIELSDIPGIGKLIGDEEIDINSIRILGSNINVSEENLEAINTKLSEVEITEIKSELESSENGAIDEPKASNTSTGDEKIAFNNGVKLSADLNIAGLELNLIHTFGTKNPEEDADGKDESIPETSTPAHVDSDDSSAKAGPKKNRMLSPVGTKLGPFFIEKIGLKMKDSKFGLEFTGGIELGPMAVQVINFSIVSALDKFAPEFFIDGLAVGYDKAPLTLSGVLLVKDEQEKGGPNKDIVIKDTFGFQGGISIEFKQVSITAIGAYAQVKEFRATAEHEMYNSFHSFFLYGYLGAPIGGPPFFFVTGIALGAGFNRDLIIPPPEKFTTFPLTAAALSPPGEAISVDSMKDMMLSLDDYIPIKEGNFWFAAGLKFESFKFLSGFLMLTVEFGDELEIGVLGIIEAIMPAAPAETLVRISIGFSVRVLPERGIVEARGSFLPTTFILHENVKLEGGMGLLAVMKDQKGGEWNGAKAGSFILTIGGYAPNYKTKVYYPKVPALKLSWQVNDNLYIGADAYLAITPEAVMFGGHFHGHFHYSKSIVSVTVDLKVGLDFILYWKPMHYIGNAYAEFHLEGTITVGYTFISKDVSLSMDASANLDIWGPDFSGKANLKFHFIVSFSVPVEFGNASKNTPLINWQEFKNSLLPSDDKIISLILTDGIIQESEKNSEEKIPLVNPYSLRLLLDTQIPIKKINHKDVKPKIGNKYANIGIKPMGLSDKLFDSSLGILINGESEIGSFQLKEVYKNVPRAIWEAKNEKYSDEELIENVVCGYEITAKRPELKDEIIISASSINDIIQGKVEGEFKTEEISNDQLKLNVSNIEQLKQEFNLV